MNRLDLQTLGSQPVIMPKSPPNHCIDPSLRSPSLHHLRYVGISWLVGFSCSPSSIDQIYVLDLCSISKSMIEH